jgi:hypothetical protein
MRGVDSVQAPSDPDKVAENLALQYGRVSPPKYQINTRARNNRRNEWR